MPSSRLTTTQLRKRCGVIFGRKAHHGSRSKRGTGAADLFYYLFEPGKLSQVDATARFNQAAVPGYPESLHSGFALRRHLIPLDSNPDYSYPPPQPRRATAGATHYQVFPRRNRSTLSDTHSCSEMVMSKKHGRRISRALRSSVTGRSCSPQPMCRPMGELCRGT